MKRFLRPRWFALAAAVLLLVFVARACTREGPVTNAYDTTGIRRGDLVATVSATGTLSAVGTVEVGTQVSGTVKDVRVDFNTRVKRGDLLALLDTESLDAAVRDATAGVARADAGLRQAEAEVNRARAQAAQSRAQRDDAQANRTRNEPLLASGFLSAQEFAVFRTAAVSADAGVISADAQIASATAGVASSRALLVSAEASRSQSLKNRRNAEIRAPISGIIIQRNVDQGQTVAASFSTPTLFVIAEDLGAMEILAQVDESDIGLVEPGQPVRFTVAAYPDSTFTGVVRSERLQPQTVQNVVLYTVVVTADNGSGLLLPGMTATVAFVVGGSQQALLVPNAALSFDPPEAVRSAARETQRAADTVRAGRDTARAGFANGLGEIWTLDAGAGNAALRPLLVRVLATDGTNTAIAPVTAMDTVVRAGLQVVIRTNETGRSPIRR